MDTLTNKEYKLLKEYDNGYNEDLDKCLQKLCDLGYLEDIPTEFDTSIGLLTKNRIYKLTSKGKAFLELQKSDKCKYWLERLIFPIIFTLVGALLTRFLMA